MPLTRTCQEPGCGKALNRWRSCGDRNCKVEAAWCDAHGGDDRAVSEMVKHIKTAHPRALPFAVRSDWIDESGAHVDKEDGK